MQISLVVVRLVTVFVNVVIHQSDVTGVGLLSACMLLAFLQLSAQYIC
jgi:hypothetical protein